jgi:hypothetical protein
LASSTVPAVGNEVVSNGTSIIKNLAGNLWKKQVPLLVCSACVV